VVLLVGVPREVVKCLREMVQDTLEIPLGERFFFGEGASFGSPKR
jgi:hypothetical protein